MSLKQIILCLIKLPKLSFFQYLEVKSMGMGRGLDRQLMEKLTSNFSLEGGHHLPSSHPGQWICRGLTLRLTTSYGLATCLFKGGLQVALCQKLKGEKVGFWLIGIGGSTFCRQLRRDLFSLMLSWTVPYDSQSGSRLVAAPPGVGGGGECVVSKRWMHGRDY